MKSSQERFPYMHKINPELALSACKAIDLEFVDDCDIVGDDQTTCENKAFEIAISSNLFTSDQAEFAHPRSTCPEMMNWIEKKASKINVIIYAIVKSEVDVEIEEARDEVSDRLVDVYLYGARSNPDAMSCKEDMGCDTSIIVSTPEDEMALVNKRFLKALIQTIKRTTDLEAVYGDDGVGFKLEEFNDYITGMED
jgi:hypothetical protein